VPFAQGVELADALKAAGVEATLQKIPGGRHGGAVFWSRDVNRLMHRFFDKHLKGIDARIEPVPESTFATTRPATTGG
jgi:dipeptidyl aminopeptidase/acylaminoacyl peptidase